MLAGLLLCAAAQAFDLHQLDMLLTRSAASSVTFVEHQYRQVLTTPIERRGELLYTPPARFEKRVTSPTLERYRLDGNTLSIELPGRKTRQLSTRNQPLLRALLLSFQAVVSGQLQLLQPVYRVELSGSAQRWQLLLTPIDAALARHIKQVVVSGQAGQPRQFEVLERSGDRVVTDITS